MIKDQLLQKLSPFEKLFDEKLGLCAGKTLPFRVNNDNNLRFQTPYNIPTKCLSLVKQDVDRLVSLGFITPTKHATPSAPFLSNQRKMALSVFLQIFEN